MACVLVPAAQAIITTVLKKSIQSKEKQTLVALPQADGSVKKAYKIPFSQKLGWLNTLLWGGSALLTAVWCGMLLVSSIVEKRAEKQPALVEEL